MRKLRVYADTSVFGGVFDDEFADDSRTFFEEVRTGKFTLVLSSNTLRELNEAPERVQRILTDLPPTRVELFPDMEETLKLREAYIESGIVGQASRADAEHVAAASVAQADMIVSWNLKHIVHFDKIRGYHGVNLIRGYSPIGIYTPSQVIEP